MSTAVDRSTEKSEGKNSAGGDGNAGDMSVGKEQIDTDARAGPRHFVYPKCGTIDSFEPLSHSRTTTRRPEVRAYFITNSTLFIGTKGEHAKEGPSSLS